MGLGLKEFREEVGIYRVVECCTGMYGDWSLGVRGVREWDLRLEDGIAAAPAKEHVAMMRNTHIKLDWDTVHKAQGYRAWET